MNFYLSTIEKQATASIAMKHQLHHVSRLILGEGMFLCLFLHQWANY